MAGICLEKCNKVSIVTCCVNRQNAKIPVPCLEIIKIKTPVWVVLISLNKKAAANKLDRESSGGRYHLRLHFDLMDQKGMLLPDMKIVLAKSLIGTYNSHSRNAPVSHAFHREVFPAGIPLHLSVLQTMRGKCRYCYTGGIGNKT